MVKDTNLPEFSPLQLSYNDFQLTCPVSKGHRMIPIRTICQIIEVDFTTQDNWIKKHPIYGQLYSPMPTTGADGKTYSMSCLSFFDTFGWLNSITQKGRKEGSFDKQLAFMAWLREQHMALYAAIEMIEAENEYERELLQKKKEELELLEEQQAAIKETKKRINEIDTTLEQINIDKVTGQMTLFSNN